MGSPARFPYGFNNSSNDPDDMMKDLPEPSLIKTFKTFADFTGLDYIAAQWTVTETQAAATQALVASDAGGEFGILALVNAAGAADINSIQLTTAGLFITDLTKKWWLFGRLSRDNADEKMGFGLQAVNATPFTLANAIWAQVNSAATAADFSIAKGSAVTTTSQAAAYPTSALNTFLKLGMYYNGKNAVFCYVNDVMVGRISTLTNLPNTAALTPTISSQNSSANARTVHVDYFGFVLER